MNSAESVCVRPGESEESMPETSAYVLDEVLGEGGMGVVYKARRQDNSVGSGAPSIYYAIKVLRKELASDAVAVKRFQQELKTTSLLTHPNIVPIYDSGLTSDGRPFFVMELLEGLTLEQVLQDEGFIDVDRLVQIGIQVSEALSHAHEKRVVHRDLKPSNIIFAGNDQYELIKVLDFGIARVFQRASRESATKMTQMGEVVGSPIYMSPEQCLSQRLDERSDIYSLGVIMYEALVGTPPFAVGSNVEILMGHLNATPPGMRKARPDFNIPPELESLVFSCLEKDPNLRPQSFKALAAELQKIGSSRKCRGFYNRIKQFPIRLGNSFGRYFKRGYKSHAVWYRRLAYTGVAAGCALVGYQYLNQHTSEEYIQRAAVDVRHGDFDAVVADWRNAITLAQKAQATPAEIAVLNERAADDVASNFNHYYDLNANNFQWAGVNREASTQISDTYRAELAKPFLEAAYKLNSNEPGRMRILDKLIIVSNKLELSTEEFEYLKLRNAQSTPDETRTARLAEIYVAKGQVKEARELYETLLRIQQSHHEQPFPSALTGLAQISHQSGDMEGEEKLRKEIVANIRSYQHRGNDYSYQFAEEAAHLANCLQELGKTAEAEKLLQESKKVKV